MKKSESRPFKGLGKVRKQNDPPSNNFPSFYANEILPNFQAQRKALENIQNIRSQTTQRVGMDKIRTKSNIGKYFVDFANTSTIHGFNHLAAPRRHNFERILAILTILGALIGLIILSYSFWYRYRNKATITVLDHDYQTFTITKPSVIICPLEYIEEANIPATFERHGIKDTPEAREFFLFLSGVTYNNMIDVPNYNDVPPSKWLQILYDLRRIQPDMKSMEWIVTERGLCLAQQSYISTYASPGYWFENNWTVVNSPKIMQHYSYETRGTNINSHILWNFSFAVTDPRDLISYRAELTKVYNLEMVTIIYEVLEIFSSEKVLDLSVQQRNCKFMTDGGLQMWPVYRYSMCVVECRFAQITHFCKCRPHFARPMDGIPICGIEQFRCINDHLLEITVLTKDTINKCNCLLDCDIINYSRHDTTKVELKLGSPAGARSSVGIIFPVDKFYRKVVYGLYDFLASVGGSAGLFLGASMLSFIEIIYFLILRLFIYQYKIISMKRKKKVMMKEHKNNLDINWKFKMNKNNFYINKTD